MAKCMPFRKHYPLWSLEQEAPNMMDVVFTATLLAGFGLILCFTGWCDKQVRDR